MACSSASSTRLNTPVEDDAQSLVRSATADWAASAAMAMMRRAKGVYVDHRTLMTALSALTAHHGNLDHLAPVACAL